MNVVFTDSFAKSLKTLKWHNSSLYKTYSLFRYDIPNFLKNIWSFRKELWSHRWWDYRFSLDIFARSISIIEEGVRTKGLEVDDSRLKKVKSMQRAIEIMKKDEFTYISTAESELGKLVTHEWEFKNMGNGDYELFDNETPEEREHNREVYKRAKELENLEWQELWEIFKGTKNSKNYGEDYDGTDIRSWWD